MVKRSIYMPKKEMEEARRAGIPESIVGKMSLSRKLTEDEKATVRGYGKVYIPGFMKKDFTLVRPQLRDLSR